MIWYQIRYQLYQHDIRSYNIISDQTTWYMISNLYDIRSDLRISYQTTCYQIRSDNFRWQLDIRSDNMISDLTTWYQISDLTICYQIWLHDIRPETTWYQIWLYDIRSDYRYQISDLTILYQIWLYDIRSYNSWCPIFSIGFLVHSWADPMPWEISNNNWMMRLVLNKTLTIL